MSWLINAWVGSLTYELAHLRMCWLIYERGGSFTHALAHLRMRWLAYVCVDSFNYAWKYVYIYIFKRITFGFTMCTYLLLNNLYLLKYRWHIISKRGVCLQHKINLHDWVYLEYTVTKSSSFTHELAYLRMSWLIYAWVGLFTHELAHLRMSWLIYAWVGLFMHKFAYLCISLLIYAWVSSFKHDLAYLRMSWLIYVWVGSFTHELAYLRISLLINACVGSRHNFTLLNSGHVNSSSLRMNAPHVYLSCTFLIDSWFVSWK